MSPFTVRIQRVRFRTDAATVASAIAIDTCGNAVQNTPRYAVTLPAKITCVEVEQGQWWTITGDSRPVEYERDGFRVREDRFSATTATLLRPSGEHIVQLISSSPRFPGIGEVKARRLWERLGESLYTALDERNTDALAEVLGPDLAQVLISGFSDYGDADTFRWFQALGIDLRLSRKLLRIYTHNARAFIEADPYRLLAFGMSWASADELAVRLLRVAKDDERRLSASVEAVLYARFDRGDTCAERSAVRADCAKLIGSELADAALEIAVARDIVNASGDTLHAKGAYLLEQAVATAIRDRLGSSHRIADRQDVEAMLVEFEAAEAAAKGQADFSLTEAQREAVRAVAEYPMVLITGGAGVGKTMVLKGIQQVLEACGQTVYAMALSGRAARRIAEATGKTAMTIAGFLTNVAPEGLCEKCTLLVDESSMLDILLAYRLVRSIPDTCRIVLIGDPAQLPPVGPGLILQTLVAVGSVPLVELTEVKRFGGEIARASNDVRAGHWPVILSDTIAQVAFVECGTDRLAEMVLRLYLEEDPVTTQILCFTKEVGRASTKALNVVCQSALATRGQPLRVFSAERERVEDTGLRVGDPLICTRNLWSHNLQNGSLGRLETIEPVPVPFFDSDGEEVAKTYAWARWDDNKLRPVTEEVLDALELAYAITVHKAQGSGFRRVIVPVFASRICDRTMLYTAMTRATSQVIFVGDSATAKRVVESPPSASRRKVALARFIEGPA